MEGLLSWLAAFAMTAVLGLVKKYTGIVDTAFGKVVKPVQPLLVMAAGWLVPLAANWLHLTAIPDAALLATAPLATVIAVACAEVLAKLQKA